MNFQVLLEGSHILKISLCSTNFIKNHVDPKLIDKLTSWKLSPPPRHNMLYQREVLILYIIFIISYTAQEFIAASLDFTHCVKWPRRETK